MGSRAQENTDDRAVVVIFQDLTALSTVGQIQRLPVAAREVWSLSGERESLDLAIRGAQELTGVQVHRFYLEKMNRLPLIRS